MGKPSRDKGARGERMWRDLLRAFGFRATRGAQQAGEQFQSDVESDCLPEMHFEVKNCSRAMPRPWIEQATRDKIRLGKRFAVVAWKPPRQPFLVVMTAEDLFEIVRRSDLPRRPIGGHDPDCAVYEGAGDCCTCGADWDEEV